MRPDFDASNRHSPKYGESTFEPWEKFVDHNQLSGIALFDGLSDDELQACAELMQEQRVLMGEHLTEESDFGYSFCVVLSGRVAVDVGGEVVNEIGAGGHFGEVSLIKDDRRNATVTATETCVVAKVMTWNFEKFCAVSPLLKDRLTEISESRSTEAE